MKKMNIRDLPDKFNEKIKIKIIDLQKSYSILEDKDGILYKLPRMTRKDWKLAETGQEYLVQKYKYFGTGKNDGIEYSSLAIIGLWEAKDSIEPETVIYDATCNLEAEDEPVELNEEDFFKDFVEIIEEEEEVLSVKDLIATLNKKQKKIYKAIKKANFNGRFYIDSMPGCGKTYPAGVIAKIFIIKFQGSTINALAPSHKAKKVLSEALGFKAKTIHSHCGYCIEGSESTTLDEEGKLIQIREPELCDLVIIDETSMVPDYLFEEAANTAPLVLALGDKNQLPVINGEPANLDNFKQYELKKQMRQTNTDKQLYKTIINIRNILEGTDTMKKFEYDDSFEKVVGIYDLADRYINENVDVIGCFTNKKTDFYNSYIHEKLTGKTNMGIDDIVILQAPAMHTYRQGSKYMSEILKNNGDEVKIRGISETPTKGILNVSLYDLEEYNFLYVDSSLYQKNSVTGNTILYDEYRKNFNRTPWRIFRDSIVRLKLPYAMTIHKLQGSTYENVGIDIQDILQSSRDQNMSFKLMYVGISRAKTKCYIKG